MSSIHQLTSDNVLMKAASFIGLPFGTPSALTETVLCKSLSFSILVSRVQWMSLLTRLTHAETPAAIHNTSIF